MNDGGLNPLTEGLLKKDFSKDSNKNENENENKKIKKTNIFNQRLLIQLAVLY